MESPGPPPKTAAHRKQTTDNRYLMSEVGSNTARDQAKFQDFFDIPEYCSNPVSPKQVEKKVRPKPQPMIHRALLQKSYLNLNTSTAHILMNAGQNQTAQMASMLLRANQSKYRDSRRAAPPQQRY